MQEKSLAGSERRHFSRLQPDGPHVGKKFWVDG